MSDGISFKVDTTALQAALVREIQKQDELSKQVAEQILIEGKNAAHQLCRKDTSNMNDGIDRASKVTRIGLCVYQWELTSDAPYTIHQEFGPMSGLKIWKFRPFLRPAGLIMQVKSREIIDRVYGG
jgi:hypothetical protein